MPLLLLGVIGAGVGVKLAGDGIDEAGNGSLKIAVAAVAVGAAVYWMRKK